MVAPETSFIVPFYSPGKNFENAKKIFSPSPVSTIPPTTEKNISAAFKFNPEIKYDTPQKWDKQFKLEDLSKLNIYVNEKDYFQNNNLNIFSNYVLSFFNEASIQKWQAKCDMTFYQNQLNFAVWCAGSGCGISVSDHLNAENNILSSVFKFHMYYQTRKILEELSCPIPGESIFDARDNKIDMIKFQKLCNEFGVPQSTDFRFKGGNSNGLGTMYNYCAAWMWRLNNNGGRDHTAPGYFPVYGNATYNPTTYQFVNQSTGNIIKIDYIKQDAALDGWKQFLLEKSSGFTKAGVTRINESIRTYVYCVLGSQAQTRSNILNSSETQQWFTNLLEQNVKSMFSIPESIAQYEDSIANTNAKIDFVVGIGLYMIPSNMVLKMGIVEKYNNNILVAKETVEIGLNESINKPILGYTSKMEVSKSPIEPKFVPEAPPINTIYLCMGVSVLAFTFYYAFLNK